MVPKFILEVYDIRDTLVIFFLELQPQRTLRVLRCAAAVAPRGCLARGCRADPARTRSSSTASHASDAGRGARARAASMACACAVRLGRERTEEGVGAARAPRAGGAPPPAGE